MNRGKLALGIALVPVLAAATWWGVTHFGAHEDKAADADAVSALVTLAPARREEMAQTVEAFGDIASGKLETVSVAQGARIAQIVVLAGQRVAKGELLAVVDNDPTGQATYAQAASALGFAEREHARIDGLFALQLATRSQLDAAAKQVIDAKAAVAAQAKLGAAQGETRLTAPFAGVVSALSVAQGDRVAAGAAVLQLGRSDHLKAMLAIEPALATQLHAGLPVSLSGPQDGAASVQATITTLQDIIDAKSQMRIATVDLNPGQQAGLIPGMRVHALIALGKRQAWSVPRQAVLSDDAGDYVFQVAKGKAHRIAVYKLVDTGTRYGIDGPLDAAQDVVVLGNYELQDGMAVREAAR